MAGFLPLLRLISFGVIILFSIITLGLSAHITNLSTQIGFYFTFAAMNIATVILTLAFLITFIVVDKTRKGAIPGMIVTELAGLGLLWILWLTTAALAAEENALRFSAGCSSRSGTVCGEFGAIVAFSFLNWIIIFAYIGVLLVLCIIQATRGNQVWFQSVSTADFNAPPKVTNQGIAPQYSQPQMGTVQPQQTGAYPPQSTPQFAQPQPQFAGGQQPQYATPTGTPQPAQSPYPQV